MTDQPGGDAPAYSLTGVVLGTPDPRGLAGFYSRLLGWPVRTDEPEWVTLRAPSGAGLAFQLEPDHVPPVWPAGPGDAQMQLHLDLQVDDLAAGVAWAQRCGATLAAFQPQHDVRVLLDPAGHPFCLWSDT